MRPEHPSREATASQTTPAELRLAARNHALPLEALRHDLTPVGLHYLLVHFDIPAVDPAAWQLTIGGRVARPLTLILDELRRRPARTLRVTMECAGNGRALLDPRPAGQPWVEEAVGTAEWTGVPLADLLAEAGTDPEAVQVVATGLDEGVESGVAHRYARSLPLKAARDGDVLVAFEMDGRALPSQHGFPARLVVPDWYGMASVKWLASLEVVDTPFVGYQQRAYRLRRSAEDHGVPLDRIAVRSLMVPPGVPDAGTRARIVTPGEQQLVGRAWSGRGPVTAVEVSADGGDTWWAADIAPPPGPFAWQAWRTTWRATPGTHELVCRAGDASGALQPLAGRWNLGGYANNTVQRVPVTVAGAARRTG